MKKDLAATFCSMMNQAQVEGADWITFHWNCTSHNFMRQIKIDLIDEFKEVGKGNEKEERKGIKGNRRGIGRKEKKRKIGMICE